MQHCPRRGEERSRARRRASRRLRGGVRPVAQLSDEAEVREAAEEGEKNGPTAKDGNSPGAPRGSCTQGGRHRRAVYHHRHRPRGCDRRSNRPPTVVGEPSRPPEPGTSAEPAYGCLRDGRKPTFRKWKTAQTTNAPVAAQLPRLRIKAGKLGGTRRCAIILKSRSDRGRVKRDRRTLRMRVDKCRHAAERDLKARNLIRSGSQAPPEMLKALIEASALAGDVVNTNKDALLFNFTADQSIERSPHTPTSKQ